MTVAHRASARVGGQLHGSVALVTGGGRGLGRVIAQALAGARAAVGVLGRSADALAETARMIEAAGGEAAYACADVGDDRATADAVRELHRRLGPIDVLVNNAGMCGPIGPMWDVPPSDWWRTIEINRAVAKSVVVKLTENLAAEVRREGVSVFSLHPGVLPIGLTEAALAADVRPDSPEARVADWLRRELAEGRGAEPARAGRLVVQLAAGRGDSLSGRHLSVHDDLDVLLERLEDIRQDDLCTLRLREFRPAGVSRTVSPTLQI